MESFAASRTDNFVAADNILREHKLKIADRNMNNISHRLAAFVVGAGNRTHRHTRTAGSPCYCTRPSLIAVAVVSLAADRSREE